MTAARAEHQVNDRGRDGSPSCAARYGAAGVEVRREVRGRWYLPPARAAGPSSARSAGPRGRGCRRRPSATRARRGPSRRGPRAGPRRGGGVRSRRRSGRRRGRARRAAAAPRGGGGGDGSGGLGVPFLDLHPRSWGWSASPLGLCVTLARRRAAPPGVDRQRPAETGIPARFRARVAPRTRRNPTEPDTTAPSGSSRAQGGGPFRRALNARPCTHRPVCVRPPVQVGRGRTTGHDRAPLRVSRAEHPPLDGPAVDLDARELVTGAALEHQQPGHRPGAGRATPRCTTGRTSATGPGHRPGEPSARPPVTARGSAPVNRPGAGPARARWCRGSALHAVLQDAPPGVQQGATERNKGAPRRAGERARASMSEHGIAPPSAPASGVSERPRATPRHPRRRRRGPAPARNHGRFGATDPTKRHHIARARASLRP